MSEFKIPNTPGAFLAAVKEKLSKEPALDDKYFAGLAERVTADVKDIEKYMAYNIVDMGMEAIANGGWFEITDTREIANPSNAGKSSVSLYDSTMAVTKNWGITGITDAGRYGSFFESQFFAGGGGSSEKADITLPSRNTDVEIKTKILDNLKRVAGEIPVGKISEQSIRDAFDKLEDPSQRALFVADITLFKFIDKMQNLLLAGVDRPDIGKAKWNKIPTVDGLETTSNKAFFTKLVYFYQLVEQAVVSMVERMITCKKVIKKSGKQSAGPSNIIAYDDGSVKKFEIALSVTNLPDAKGVVDIITANAGSFYRGKKILFDDTSPNHENAKTFFKRILEEHKQGTIER